MNKVTSVDGHPTVVRDLSETIFDGIAYLGLQNALYIQGCGSAFIFMRIWIQHFSRPFSAILFHIRYKN
jgi:hypothetical protein